jgi:formamidopyrimidine-DNA glycosylase
VPELPDITIYLESLERRVLGKPVERVRLPSSFLLRSVEPPISEAEGKLVVGLHRIGKRIVFALEADLFLAFHLMIAGRFHWKERGSRVPAKIGLAALDFPNGTLLLTEASSKKRAT